MEFYIKRPSGIYIERAKPCKEAMPAGKGEWKVGLNTIDELCGFVKNFNAVVISENKGRFILTIYDAY